MRYILLVHNVEKASKDPGKEESRDQGGGIYLPGALKLPKCFSMLGIVRRLLAKSLAGNRFRGCIPLFRFA